MSERELGRQTKSHSTTTPEGYTTVPPNVAYPSGDYSYILEIVMGMQKTLGQVEQAVKTMTDDFREERKKISRLRHIIYAAGVVGTIGLAILVFLANKFADVFIASLKHTP
jgi:hypothetical protein